MPTLDPPSAIVAALEREQLIPDVLPQSFRPSTLFSLTWPSGKELISSSTELTVEETQEEPDISIAPARAPDPSVGGEATYTLVMVDPDAPSRADPLFKEFRHWVITGLKQPPAHGAAQTALKTKPSTTPYRPPGPRPGSGLHRYTFLLFQEPTSSPLSIPEGAPEYGAALEERRSWSATKFGETYGLKLVGANFFLVRSAD